MYSRRSAVISIICGALCPRVHGAQLFPKSKQTTQPGQFTALGCGAAQLQRVPGERLKLSSSGNRTADRIVTQEFSELYRHFHVGPMQQFHDDMGIAEALTLPGKPEALITIGRSLVEQEVALNPGQWTTAFIGILAHEWAHAFQYSHLLQERAYVWETHADFLAGWYIGSRIAAGASFLEPEVFAVSLRAKGNRTGFFDPDTHGLPKQRVDAMYAGVAEGRSMFHPQFPPYPSQAAEKGYIYVKNAVP